MNTDNSRKAQSGKNNKNEMSTLINDLNGKFTNVVFKNKTWKDYVTFGMPNKDQRQFKANEVIIFNDDIHEVWLIKTSSSVRGDRCKSAEFDIEHIRRILAPNFGKIKAFYVIKDNQSVSDLKQFMTYKHNIKSGKIVSYFDDVLKFSEFQNLLKERCTKYIAQGITANILGNDSEQEISDAFNNPNNVVLWNNPQNSVIQSRNIYIFTSLIQHMTNCKDIKKTIAYNNNKKDKKYFADELNVVRDKNGKGNLGKPKTDVLIIVSFTDGTQDRLKISVKHPKNLSTRVTVHEGDVQSLVNDLENSLPKSSIFNDKRMFVSLKNALLDFQKAGSAKNMSAKYNDFLNQHLSDLNEWLIDYFLFGINNSKLNEDQIANVLTIIDPKDGSLVVKSIEEEKQLLLDYCQQHKLGSSSFGTPFSWTYPSKKKGKKIQIKSPLPF